jgi:hypothetical protein
VAVVGDVVRYYRPIIIEFSQLIRALAVFDKHKQHEDERVCNNERIVDIRALIGRILVIEGKHTA